MRIRNVTSVVLLFIVTTSVNATENYQDWWWNENESGMGWNVGQQDDTVTVAWYLYELTESPSFLTLAGALVGNAVEGTLFRSFGPPPGPAYNADDVERVAVGTARMVFQASNQASFTYDYDGLSGEIVLERLSYDFEDFSGEYIFTGTGDTQNCSDPQNNEENWIDTGRFSISQNGNALSITAFNDDDEPGEECFFNLLLSQNGSYYDGGGTFSCGYGVSGTAEFLSLRKIDRFLMIDYEFQVTDGEICSEQGGVSLMEY